MEPAQKIEVEHIPYAGPYTDQSHGYDFSMFVGDRLAKYECDRTPKEFISQEHALLYAVLEDALSIVGFPPISTHGAPRKSQPVERGWTIDTIEWFLSEDANYFFSFESICDVFGLQAKRIRAAVVAKYIELFGYDPRTAELQKRAKRYRAWHQYDVECGCERCQHAEQYQKAKIEKVKLTKAEKSEKARVRLMQRYDFSDDAEIKRKWGKNATAESVREYLRVYHEERKAGVR